MPKVALRSQSYAETKMRLRDRDSIMGVASTDEDFCINLNVKLIFVNNFMPFQGCKMLNV